MNTQIKPPVDCTRWLFLRLLGIIYFIAFASTAWQIVGLLGQHGVLPVSEMLYRIGGHFATADNPGLRYYFLPTLFWLNSSDAALQLLCWGGMASALCVVAGVLTGPALFICYVLYLSLVTVGQDFLAFQWDFLLLEAGVISIFLAPWRLLEPPLGPRNKSRASVAFLWVIRLLLFKLMFLSGVCKLASHDPTWANFSALDYHYETQPLPTPLAWLAGQLPHWWQHISVGLMFAIELIVPFAIFCGRKARAFAAISIFALQCLIALTGNYTFFNILTMAMCITLLDDGFIAKILPGKLRAKISCSEGETAGLGELPEVSTSAETPAAAEKATIAEGTASVNQEDALVRKDLDLKGPLASATINGAGRWTIMRRIYVGMAILLGIVNISAMTPVAELGMLNEVLAPFAISNRYGLFAVMTTVRHEIIIEGSNDRKTWLAYEFPFKPGDVKRAPPIVAPFQPRLDWQMWFAALSNYEENPWLGHLMLRLLHGDREVLALFSKNPFAKAPPKYVRASLYTYHFTDIPTLLKTGAWWRRDPAGQYFPVATLQGSDSDGPITGPY